MAISMEDVQKFFSRELKPQRLGPAMPFIQGRLIPLYSTEEEIQRR